MDESELNGGVWCTLCGVHVSHVELEAHGQPSCPQCGDAGVPCNPSDDVTVQVNWHELRILTIFAMHHAHSLTDIGPRRAVTAICQRLAKQYPDKAPLTMAGEFKQLKEISGVTDLEVRGMPDFDEFVEVYGPGAVHD